jgi:hypothetical protein
VGYNIITREYLEDICPIDKKLTGGIRKMSAKETKTNTSQLEKMSAVKSSFRNPMTEVWKSLQATQQSEDELREVESANETLKNTLLQSLQMQHIVVLAGSGCSYHAGGPAMTDLWNAVVNGPLSEQAQSAAQLSHYGLEAENIEEFLSQVEAFQILEKKKPTEEFLKEAKQVILTKCSQLKPEKLTAHETLLHRLSRRRTRDQRLHVFTTNYDLCFEYAAANIGCVAIDGFSFMAPRQYDPRYFDFDIIRRPPRHDDDNWNYLEGVFLLYKLHGSVNWEKTDNGIVEKEKPDPQKACLIYPASGKYQQSYSQPFIESISQYLAALREPNTCLLVIGFGFNDDHLSEPLLSAARSNPHLRLIIVDPRIEQNAKSPKRYIEKFLELSERGEDIWFINESFEDFANRIPDLKSLTPAERLFKDIKGVIQQQ